MQQQARGVPNVGSDHVFMGNGVSELIDLTLRGLLEPGRRSADPEPGLSAVDGRDRAERRQGGALSVPRVARLQPRRRGDRGADHPAHARARRDQPEQSDRRGL